MRNLRATTTSRTSLSLLTGASLLAIAPAALAQDNEETDEPRNEIVVTALKREQNLQDVPMAITALGNQQLEELQVNEMRDVVKFLP